MRLVRPVSACVFILAASTLIPMQITAAELTDGEIGQFRNILEERSLPPREKAGRLSDGEASVLRGLLEQFRGITFGGYIVNYYQYESVDPPAGDSRAIPPTLYNKQVNSFTVKDIELWLDKKAPNPGDIGFKIALDWGDRARRLTSNGPVRDDSAVQPNPPGAPTGARQTTFSQAYVTWNIPVGNGLTAKFGKFLNWVGYERKWSIWNPNFSASYISKVTPGRSTGFWLSYDVTERFLANYYFVNTTGTFVNNNKSFSHGVEFRYSPPDFAFFKDVGITLGALWGPEHAGNDSDWRQTYDLTIEFSPIENLTLVTDSYWSYDPVRIIQPSGRAKNNNKAWGVAQYVIYNYTDSVEFVLRGGYFWDQDNLERLSGGDGASLAEVTGTINLRLRENIMFRPEVRYDKIINVPDGPSHIWNGHNKNITGSIAVSYQF
ncbi:MAG: outer membrane beta-barrel protein [Planctomycetes bacterium]|nr:outer membrane beta-barrel protein [Planctomycetota bacterium]